MAVSWITFYAWQSYSFQVMSVNCILCSSSLWCSDPAPAAVPQSDVYRMLHSNQEEPSQPRQSGSFKVLQNLVSEEGG